MKSEMPFWDFNRSSLHYNNWDTIWNAIFFYSLPFPCWVFSNKKKREWEPCFCFTFSWECVPFHVLENENF